MYLQQCHAEYVLVAGLDAVQLFQHLVAVSTAML
jgi:hypothetical protein